MSSARKSASQHPARAAGDAGTHAKALRGAVWVLALLAGGAAAGSAERRDPFTFGPRSPTAGGGASELVSGRGGATLTGILWDAASPLVIIGGEPFTVGQTIGGWQIVAIQPDHVVIQRGERRVTLVSGSDFPSDD